MFKRTITRSYCINTHYLLCAECDLLIQNKIIEEGSYLKCPRCGHVLYKQKYNTIIKSLALSITALICFYPAVTEPIMSLSMGGKEQHQNIIEGALVLLKEEHYIVAVLTFMCSLLIPLFRLLLLFYVTLSLSVNYFSPHLFWTFRLYHYMEEWGMLDVYMLGVIVSVVKLSSMAEIQFGFGFWMYAMLLICSIMANNELNHHEVWDRLLAKKKAFQ
ncbi:MAG: paraquat-inducible protein A [Gammaproteobacteria bacterium]|nr:paraquat-inducible protein A [Gammaproteobacteria bacterium]